MAQTNAEAWQTFLDYRGGLSAHARKVGFAGVAICWFFRSEKGQFPALILLALLGFVTFFVLDAAQYWRGARRHKAWIEKQEGANRAAGKHPADGDFTFPKELDRPAWKYFNWKLAVLHAAFGVMGIELVRQMLV